ncbi:hypothetical protein EV668_1548 [Enterovirga rhinocerotis]|uniref:Uncharacterized protein n=1 Tax=Enterovirga rhinocerotis TaxID=1339210 RepID=A0A4R7CA73_9HYPH|nr:hypothetical protein EV668_1548 [Enterovirga rhinocerotis]
MATQGYGNQDTAPPNAAPSRSQDKPGSDEVTGRKDPPSRKEERDEVNTPGDGAGPARTPDEEADPGVG